MYFNVFLNILIPTLYQFDHRNSFSNYLIKFLQLTNFTYDIFGGQASDVRSIVSNFTSIVSHYLITVLQLNTVCFVLFSQHFMCSENAV